MGSLTSLRKPRNRLMPKPDISYNRTPSPELQAQLEQGEFLSPILDLRFDKVKVDNLGLDIHFRRNDVVQVYCGLTRVIELKRLRRSGKFRLSADKHYMKQTCGMDLFREWSENDKKFARELYKYLDEVKIDPRFTSKEGAIQQRWSYEKEHWIPFDREARLEYKSKRYRESVKNFEGVESAYRELMRNWQTHQNGKSGDRWAKPKKTGMKVDQLAIDKQGQLVLIEIKDSEERKKNKGNESEIYYSPFQLLQYIWEWRQGLNNVPTLLAQLQSLLDARKKAKLVGSPQSSLTGDIRAAVCFGTDGRSPEVKRRYGFVIDVVSRHLPPGVESIETWIKGDDCEAQRL